MMLSKSGVTLGAMCATIVVLFFALFYLINNKHKVNKKIGRLHSSQSFDVVSKKKEKKIDVLLDRLDKRLKDAEIKMPVNRFLAIILFASVATYSAGYILTDTWLVPVGLLSFPLYFVPDMIISSKRDKVIARFNTELIMVLRRMSAITKNDSVLRALEDVKDYPVYSEKMRILLNKIYLHFSFGDSIEEAFNKVAEEHPSKLLKLVAISINVNKSLGSNLSANLHEIATQIQSEMLMKKEADSEKVSEAMSALQVLGYTRKEIEKAFENFDKADLSVEDIIKKGLLYLAK